MSNDLETKLRDIAAPYVEAMGHDGSFDDVMPLLRAAAGLGAAQAYEDAARAVERVVGWKHPDSVVISRETAVSAIRNAARAASTGSKP